MLCSIIQQVNSNILLHNEKLKNIRTYIRKEYDHEYSQDDKKDEKKRS